MLLPPRVAAFMPAQHGLLSRRQWRELGGSIDAYDSALRRGLLERVHRGVVRQPGAARPPEQPLLAAVLRARPGAVLAGQAAAGLHGLEGFSIDDPMVIWLPPGRRLVAVPFTWRDHPPVLGPDRTRVRGVPVVTVARFLLDAAPDVPERRWRVAFDSGRRLGSVSETWLRRRALAQPEHPGSGIALARLDAGVAEQDTGGERALARLLALLGVAPEWQVWLLPGIRVDALWRSARLVVEFDGRDHHTLPSDLVADLARQRELEEAGYRVERVTWAMIRDDPLGTIARLDRIRREREAGFAAA